MVRVERSARSHRGSGVLPRSIFVSESTSGSCGWRSGVGSQESWVISPILEREYD